MDNQGIKYKTRKVTIPKGKKESTLTKMNADGWELTEELDGTSRSMLTFRKPTKSLNMKLAIPSGIGVVALVAGIAFFSFPEDIAETEASVVASANSSTPSDSPLPAEDPELPAPSTTDETYRHSTAILTVENSPELAQVLTESEYCSGSFDEFAKAYAGETIEFDGHISNILPGGGHRMIHDALLSSGDYGYRQGPAFKFTEGPYDPGLGVDLNDPSVSMAEGQPLHIIAKIKSYDPNSCLFYVEPVEISLR